MSHSRPSARPSDNDAASRKKAKVGETSIAAVECLIFKGRNTVDWKDKIPLGVLKTCLRRQNCHLCSSLLSLDYRDDGHTDPEKAVSDDYDHAVDIQSYRRSVTDIVPNPFVTRDKALEIMLEDIRTVDTKPVETINVFLTSTGQAHDIVLQRCHKGPYHENKIRQAAD